MADPTLVLTLADMQIRVAEYLGIAYYGANGQGAAQVPVNAHDLDLVTRLVNDGYRRFLNDNARWNFLNVPLSLTFNSAQVSGLVTAGTSTTFTDSSLAGIYADNALAGWGLSITHSDTSIDELLITSNVGATGVITFSAAANETPAAGDLYQMMAPPNVAGQTWRYYMPDDFYGELLTPWTYNIGGPRLEINTVADYTIRQLRAGANTSGTVSTCSFRPINTTVASTGKRWEALFWPSPASINTITAVYKRYSPKLALGTDRSVAGFQHDDSVLAAGIAEAERQRGDAIGPREQTYQSFLTRSKIVDARVASVRASEYGDRSEDRVPFGRRPLSYYGVDTYGGGRIP